MKRNFLVFWMAALASVLVLPMTSIAVPVTVTDYTGTRTSEFGYGIFATDGWDYGNFSLSWNISYDPINYPLPYKYEYTIYIPEIPGIPAKGLSHWILEISPGISGGYFDPAMAPTTYTEAGPGKSNPGLPGELYGIKFEDGLGTGENYFSFYSTQSPMWGDFYAKDGVDNPKDAPKIDVIAYNIGFGTNPSEAGPFTNWIAVPNTETTGKVPEPISLILLGSGLTGAGLYRRMRKGRK